MANWPDRYAQIPRQEVSQLLRDMQYSNNEEEISALISEIDADNNGTIEPGEFLALMARYDNVYWLRLMLTITKEEDQEESFKILSGKEQDVITF